MMHGKDTGEQWKAYYQAAFAERALGARWLPSHPGRQIGGQWRVQFPPTSAAACRTLAVDLTLDVEQRIDVPHRLQRNRRDHAWRFLSALRWAPASTSASTETGRRAWAQRAASREGPGRAIGFVKL